MYMSGNSIWDVEIKREDSNKAQSGDPSKPPGITLHANVMKGLHESKFPKPNKVQLKVLPNFTESNYHLVIVSPTQSGKTVSAILGILDQISNSTSKYDKALFVSPTHETAELTYACAQKLGAFCNISIHFLNKVKTFVNDRKNSREIFVGTPDKIMDLSRSSHVDFKKVGFLFLDDADYLSNLRKYFKDVSLIHQKLSSKCRTVVCITSKNDVIIDFLEKHLMMRIEIEVEVHTCWNFRLKQLYLVCGDNSEKSDALVYLVTKKQFPGQAVVFCETKDTVNNLAKVLQAENVASVILSGDLTVPQKKSVLEMFRDGNVEVLITTRAFASVIQIASATKLIHFDQLLDEKYSLDINTYKMRERLLSRSKECLEVYFFEKKWEEYLFEKDKVVRNEKTFFNAVEIVPYDKLKTYF